MAYNHNTGELTYNGRTYTPGGLGARRAFETIRHFAEDTTGFPAGPERDGLLAAVRMFYGLPLSAPAFQLARTVVRALREERAALALTA
ncbi:hypothetical protein F3K40_15235 [Streptomyces sp. LBUM 1478]|uniref:hypothetical protein n=1 Tax=Streptomyces scabiei TaxID=1930 RepID=UPI000765F680|nr:hypothetical protein [Streptomyces scabiei]MBP5906810.1 hypothetical protein [Streptomyces sp. LBUM 1478]MBP5930464.1 hypothetical protein [Streptomyces sp. LBUM 1479]